MWTVSLKQQSSILDLENHSDY
uniref:Uncharacterized protein n=1 Tax=Anguilla anguilla TaxID=7936 RepID=A0A0E9US34_ANGAN